jgi:hypothetical protein
VPPIATGLPWDVLGLARLLRLLLERALPPEPFVESLPVRPDSPQEDQRGYRRHDPAALWPRMRAHILWDLDGRSERRTLDYCLQAEKETVYREVDRLADQDMTEG